MKYKLILIVTLAISFSCNKEKRKILKQYNGYFTALKNGKYWEGRIRTETEMSNHEYLFLSFDVLDKKYSVSEELIIGHIKSTINTNKIDFRINDSITNAVLNNTPYANFFNVDGGDLTVAVYETDTTKNNFISVTKIEVEKFIIEGIFQVTLFNKYPSDQFADTLIFTNGKFETTEK